MPGATTNWWTSRYLVGKTLPSNAPWTVTIAGCRYFRTFLPARDIICTKCQDFIRLIAILIHENVHIWQFQTWETNPNVAESIMEMPAYERERTQMDTTIRELCCEIVKQGFCADAKACGDSIDTVVSEANNMLAELKKHIKM